MQLSCRFAPGGRLRQTEAVDRSRLPSGQGDVSRQKPTPANESARRRATKVRPGSGVPSSDSCRARPRRIGFGAGQRQSLLCELQGVTDSTEVGIGSAVGPFERCRRNGLPRRRACDVRFCHATASPSRSSNCRSTFRRTATAFRSRRSARAWAENRPNPLFGPSNRMRIAGRSSLRASSVNTSRIDFSCWRTRSVNGPSTLIDSWTAACVAGFSQEERGLAGSCASSANSATAVARRTVNFCGDRPNRSTEPLGVRRHGSQPIRGLSTRNCSSGGTALARSSRSGAQPSVPNR